MEEAVLEDHLGGHAGRQFGEGATVDAGLVECFGVIDLDAADALEGQHARRGRLPDDPRDVHLVVLREVRREALRVASLAQVVQLGPQRLGELVGQPDDVVVAGRLPVPAGMHSHVSQYLQVLCDLLHDAGPAHLDDHLGAVEQRGSVRLTDRRCGQRDDLEARERGLGVVTELVGDELADRVAGHGRRGVLQLGQLDLVLGTEQVRARREDLPELDERRAELLERQPYVLWLRVGLLARLVAEQPAMKRHAALETEHAHEIAQPVTRERLGDLAVAIAMVAHRWLPPAAGMAGGGSALAQPAGGTSRPQEPAGSLRRRALRGSGAAVCPSARSATGRRPAARRWPGSA